MYTSALTFADHYKLTVTDCQGPSVTLQADDQELLKQVREVARSRGMNAGGLQRAAGVGKGTARDAIKGTAKDRLTEAVRLKWRKFVQDYGSGTVSHGNNNHRPPVTLTTAQALELISRIISITKANDKPVADSPRERAERERFGAALLRWLRDHLDP